MLDKEIKEKLKEMDNLIEKLANLCATEIIFKFLKNGEDPLKYI